MAQEHNAHAQLEVAFDAFNQMSSQLEASYRDLEQRVAELSRELAATHHERRLHWQEKVRLADRQQQLHALLPGGVVVLDGDNRVSECNPAACELLGEPLLNENWDEVIARAFVLEDAEGGEVMLRNQRRVSITTRALDFEPGQIVLLLDVTEQHALHDLLQRQKHLSAMGEMAASLAHQVRTPLTSAMLYVSQLAGDELPEAERKRFAEKGLGRLRHLEHMVNDMLHFARSGAFAMEAFPVHRLVDEVCHSVQPLVDRADGSLMVHLHCPDVLVWGNCEALHSAILNIAVNAVEMTGPGVQIEIDVRAREQRLIVAVADNGPGMGPEVRQRLFTPFFTTRSQGTGLGLAVVRSIVQAHEGSVEVDSQAGAGCTFRLQIPLAAGKLALPSHANRAAAPAPAAAGGREHASLT